MTGAMACRAGLIIRNSLNVPASIRTLQRLADGMGMKLKVEFVPIVGQ